MEELNKLLFELSNEERIKILTELQTHKLKLSQLSKKFEIPVSETSRHLQRLNDYSLIIKNGNGTYQLTQLGETSLTLISNLRFLLNRKEFFLQYDLSGIPCELINRIEELEHSEYISDAFRNLELAQEKFGEADKFIWILSDNVLRTAVPILEEKLKSNSFEVRLILPETIMPAEDRSRIPLTHPNVQKRTLPQVKTTVLATENYATLALPTVNGKMDYTGFNSTDERFRKWCKDLFMYYWEMAKPVRRVR